MDGYSLTSGYYGGQRPIALRSTKNTPSTKTSTIAQTYQQGNELMCDTVANSVATTGSDVVLTHSVAPLTHFVPSSHPKSSMSATNIMRPSSSPHKSSQWMISDSPNFYCNGGAL
jgi:hypothetical protein